MLLAGGVRGFSTYPAWRSKGRVGKGEVEEYGGVVVDGGEGEFGIP